MSIKIFSALGLTAAALLGAGNGIAQPAEAKLRAAVFLPPKASFGWPFARWVDSVNKECAGKVNITVVGPESIGAFEQPNALRTGVVDMLSGPPAYYKGMMVEGDTAILSNMTLTEQRRSGAWEMLNKLHNEKVNAWYLTAYGNGVKFHIYTNKPMKDGRLDGLTLRSSPNYLAFFRALGARTANMPPPDVYTALERNAVDGYGWPLWGITDFGWHKVTKFRYDPGFYDVVVNILVNLNKWKSLSGEQRKCLSDRALWLEQQWPQWKNETDAREEQAQKDAGIQAVNLGDAHRRKAEDIYWEELEKASPANVKRLRGLLVK